MTERINRAHVDAKVVTVNRMLGIENPNWNVPGSVELDGAYGGHRVDQVTSEGHSVTPLSGFGYGTLRECANFLDGMIAALRITQGS